MLATTSIGAIWSGCGPDFGPRGVLDRFSQLTPKVLFCVDGYQYGGKPFDRRAEMTHIAASAADARARRTRAVPRSRRPTPLIGPRAIVLGRSARHDRRSRSRASRTSRCRSQHPLWILFSSGTTGLPKPIVHGHGGITIEQMKNLQLPHGRAPAPAHVLLHDDRLDDVELPRERAAVGRRSGAVRRQPGVARRPTLLWRMIEQLGAQLLRREPDLPADPGEGRHRAARAFRPELSSTRSRSRVRPSRRNASAVVLREREARPVGAVGQRRHGRLQRILRRRRHTACLRGRDPGAAARRVADRRSTRTAHECRRRGRRDGHHRADAVDAGLLLERSRTTSATSETYFEDFRASGATAISSASTRAAAASCSAAPTRR